MDRKLDAQGWPTRFTSHARPALSLERCATAFPTTRTRLSRDMASARSINHAPSSQSAPKARKVRDRRKPHLAKFSPRPRPLGCPYRKRHPLGFNIRDARPCCGGFATVSDVIAHVRSFHDCHEDGMPYLPDPLGRPETETWAMVYKALFSDKDSSPSPCTHLSSHPLQ